LLPGAEEDASTLREWEGRENRRAVWQRGEVRVVKGREERVQAGLGRVGRVGRVGEGARGHGGVGALERRCCLRRKRCCCSGMLGLFCQCNRPLLPV